MGPADPGGSVDTFMFGGQAQVIVSALGENVSSQVGLVDPLHNDHFGSGLGIVQAGRHHLVPPVAGTFPDDIGLGVVDIVRIVAHDAVATLPCVGASQYQR